MSVKEAQNTCGASVVDINDWIIRAFGNGRVGNDSAS